MAKREHTSPEGLIQLASAFPWWVGLILAAATFVVLLGIANLEPPRPSETAGIGATAGMHLWAGFASVAQYVIPIALAIGAGLSAVGRLRRKQLLAMAATHAEANQMFTDMSWQEFEMLVGEAFRRRGYKVTETGGGGADGGIDLVLTRGRDKHLVQCKHWKARQVGVTPVREFYGVMVAERAAHGYLVTSGTFTKGATTFADGKHLELVDGPALFELIRQVTTAKEGADVPANTTNATAESKSPVCPKCGAQMVMRVAKQGPRNGQKFWGCSGFPACRGTRPVARS